MKLKLLAIGGALAVLAIGTVFTSGGSARADGGPHVSGQSVTTDACAGCHRAHTAAAPDLLKASESTLCFTCHDGTAATTKPDAGVTTGGGALRAGGFNAAYINTQDQTWSRHVTTCGTGTDPHEYGTGASNTPTTAACGTNSAAQILLLNSVLAMATTTPPNPTAVTSRHQVETPTQNTSGAPTGTIWAYAGAGAGTLALKCTSCHDPHGTGGYRILRSNPLGDSGTSMTDKFTTGVTIPDDGTAPHNYATTNYFDVSYAPSTPDMTTGTGISAWCAQCHQKYLANTGSYGDLSKSGDSTKYMHATTSYAPTCIKCHAAHGTNAVISGGSDPVGGNYAGNVTYPDGTSAASTAVNTRLLKVDNRGICQKCHKR